jgi:Uma2 family endonuclease
MMQPARPLRPTLANGIRHVRPPRPLAFAAFEEMPETKRHLLLRTALYQSLELEFSATAWLGSDQFVYWDAGDDARKLAPDTLVRLGGPDEDFDVWKTWERGAPHLCVEIVSRSDRGDLPWAEKLARYRQAGVEELVRFDDLAPEGERFRVWDRVKGDLVERALQRGERPLCRTLKLWWHEGTLGHRVAPRLARDAGGKDLLPTPKERAAAEAKGRAEEAKGRADAEQRVVELEHRLASLQGKESKAAKAPTRSRRKSG